MTIYSQQDLLTLHGSVVPRHVAIIPDGNRRWARQNAREALEGHRAGSNILVTLVEAAQKLGIKVLTIYAFSTENWSRSPLEVEGLMNLLVDYLRSQLEPMIKQGVKLGHIGDLSSIPQNVREEFIKTEQATCAGTNIDLVLAINYGGRDEICRAVRRLVDDCQKGKKCMEEIDEKLISSYLDTVPWGDPDLVIRTSGEHRTSNFLLWQSSYSEWFFESTLWPDFGPKQLLDAVFAYQRRDQRLGK